MLMERSPLRNLSYVGTHLGQNPQGRTGMRLVKISRITQVSDVNYTPGTRQAKKCFGVF